MTYLDPFRLRLLKGLTAVLQTVTPANGYVNDLSNAVFRGRLTFGSKDPLPMVAIIEPPVADPLRMFPENTTQGFYCYNVIVQGFVADDALNPTDPALVLLADVKRAIGLEIRILQTKRSVAFGVAARRLGRATMDFGVCRPSDDISSKAFFWLPLKIEIAEDYLSPYED